MSSSNKDWNQVLADFLKDTDCLILDSNAGSRGRLIHALTDFGADPSRIIAAQTLEQAETEIRNRNPKLIVADLFLNSQPTIGLRSLAPDSIFLVVSAFNAHVGVAQAVEADIDGIVFKPFRLDTLKGILAVLVKLQLFPGEYLQKVTEGLTHIDSGNPDLAIRALEEAKRLNPTPSLACYWLAQAEFKKDNSESAITALKEGLGHNRIHYKSLTGLTDIYLKQEKLTEAYELVRRLVQFYPGNGDRLKSALKLAIQTENIPDINDYLQIFLRLRNCDDELVKYMNSALIVACRHYLGRNLPAKAFDYCDKVVDTFRGKTQFLKYTIELLAEYGHHQKARELLSFFPEPRDESEDYCTSQYLIECSEVGTQKSIPLGQKLLKSGFHNPSIYSTLIEGLILDGQHTSASDLLTTALVKFPSHVDRFEHLVAALKSHSGVAIN